jgi:hypothetical protein
MKSSLFSLLYCSYGLLAGCAMQPQVPAPGQSLCDAETYNTIRGKLAMLEQSMMLTPQATIEQMDPSSSRLGGYPLFTKVARTRVAKGSKGDAKWTEIWTVERIGTDAEYTIHFSPSSLPGGGIHYEIMLPPKPAS